MDFVNKIVNNGKRPSELPFKSNIPAPAKGFADKLDNGFDFNFPAIPAYEGI